MDSSTSPLLGSMGLCITGGAMVLRLLTIPLLRHAEGTFRQRKAGAVTDASPRMQWTPVCVELLLQAGVAFGVFLFVLEGPVGARSLAPALWSGKSGNFLDLGYMALEYGAWERVNDGNVAPGTAFLVLFLVMWLLTRRSLLKSGMPDSVWRSARTQQRLLLGIVVYAALLVAVLPTGTALAAATWQAVTFAAGFKRHEPVLPPQVSSVPAQAPRHPALHRAPTAPAQLPFAPASPAGTEPPAPVSRHQELYPQEPRAIGAYQLLGRIGAGGMGTVYVARREGSATQVALKTINPELLGDPGVLSRFEREAEALTMVSGAYTARVLDSGVADGRPFLVMELLDGSPLDAHLREHGPMRTAQALRAFALALATSLAAVHRLGLVHRDLKPGNIMLTSAGPRLLDFGIATIVERTRVTKTGGTPGTLTYMAPEQFTEAQAAPAADVWAWACCVVAAVHGDSPFAGTSIGAVYHRVTQSGPDPAAIASLHAVDPALEALVHRALSPDPAKRPADGASLLALLPQGPGDTIADPQAVHRAITQGWQSPMP